MEIWMLQVSCDLYPKVFVGDGQVYKPSTTSTSLAEWVPGVSDAEACKMQRRVRGARHLCQEFRVDAPGDPGEIDRLRGSAV